ncbi:hypothetical protein [Neolewinella agarilytica]|uniref:Uncharacterized protein n=1 Tax=Neolewinella agarilytica TaxID=478744 RepID=A0A1H9MSQ9_9BACT|nr:hypothetical protein [Neolewinella agarilytica]SER26668.1 hypothetical protein SAMN05444359_13130 [Neolewinella agarilytica]
MMIAEKWNNIGLLQEGSGAFVALVVNYDRYVSAEELLEDIIESLTILLVPAAASYFSKTLAVFKGNESQLLLEDVHVEKIRGAIKASSGDYPAEMGVSQIAVKLIDPTVKFIKNDESSIEYMFYDHNLKPDYGIFKRLESEQVLNENQDSGDNSKEDNQMSIDEILGREYLVVREDAEHFWDAKCYLDFLKKIASVFEKTLDLIVKEQFFEDGYECFAIESKGVRKVVKLKITSDWIDTTILLETNKLLEEVNSEVFLYMVDIFKDPDQTFYLVATTKEKYELLRKSGYVLQGM